MPLLEVNVSGAHARIDPSVLAHALAALPKGAPVVICIHGFKFSPHAPETSPHLHILSLDPRPDCWKAMSWPRALGFGRGRAEEGLCIALGWDARGTIWQAWKRAPQVSRALARLIAQIDRPVHVVGHSLGARVALGALPLVRRGTVARIILLAAAEFRSTAQAAMDSPAGTSVEVFNITSRENDLFDVMLEKLVRAPVRGDRALGAGLGTGRGASAPPPLPRWLDIQIDAPATLAALGYLGFTVAGPERRICHWSAYLRGGMFSVYTALIRTPERLPLGLLRELLPQEATPRWSRLIGPWPARLPLPFGRKATS
ncbi:Alpha/beta hydrolase family protein [Aquimixticola soesokkakensis]|uniref:Alpha/beta hydrolase family protein n=1 Tax=Aquimixticola soesokkakensis TaxID=1519096 RepID=A0A1Y5S6J7_9RHOB|nr:alpha/beta hydrolase [Aquimixticola soesokkakensis]SLN31266.1 Alpha/beta hydrolase family protein [Aquimixticola soesokkakensis]